MNFVFVRSLHIMQIISEEILRAIRNNKSHIFLTNIVILVSANLRQLCDKINQPYIEFGTHRVS